MKKLNLLSIFIALIQTVLNVFIILPSGKNNTVDTVFIIIGSIPIFLLYRSNLIKEKGDTTNE